MIKTYRVIGDEANFLETPIHMMFGFDHLMIDDKK